MLKQAKQSPDIDNYLCLLLASQAVADGINVQPDSLHAARSAAGIMLKNNVKTHYKKIAPASQTYIRSTILVGLKDPNAQIRNYVGNVITEIVHQAGVHGWPEVLPELMSTIANTGGQVSTEAQEGAMGALLKVCEDNKRSLAKTHGSQNPLDYVITKLLEFMVHPLPKVRSNAIAALNIFIVEKSQPLLENLDGLLTQLFNLTTDGNSEVRKQVCRSIVQIAEMAPGSIAPHMGGLVEFMVAQQRNGDDAELSLDAAEFWLCVGEDKQLRETLGPYLSQIVPVLLESMVYSEDDVLRLEAEAEDAEEEDREQDIRPQFATGKGAKSAGGVSNITYDDDDDLSEGELEDEDDEDEDDPEVQWNLRKCSAAALDVLASVFHQPVFESTLPYLKENLNNAAWANRESAVLAIGAIADGCMEVVEPHLPELIPYLVSLLDDPMPVVRQITCWSLGRYSAWASHLDASGKESYFLPMMDGILKRMLDNNKRVQEAAASAFANLEEKANKELENPKYCEVIARQFAECFAKYKDRNMFILYDCVQTLAEHVGSTLQSPELVHYLMPALLGRWEKVNDRAQEMFPLLECLSYVATALGNTFLPYAKPIYDRCIKIIYMNLQEAMAAVENPSLDAPDPDFLVTSLDLCSSIIQALGEEGTTRIVTGSQPSIFDLLPVCLEDQSADVRQSAYALLGDCAIYVFPLLQPSLQRILPNIITQLDRINSTPGETNFAVTNNACWSCGEISMREGQALLPYAEAFLERFYAILSNTSIPVSLHENAAIALGRLGNGCASILAPHLATLAPPFVHTMKSIEWTDEKAHAMKGISEVIILNPQGTEQCLLDFVLEIARAPNVPSLAAANGGPYDLFQKVYSTKHPLYLFLDYMANSKLSQILTLYKDNIPNFPMLLQHLPPGFEEVLRQMYSI